jgi:hypothetical protein
MQENWLDDIAVIFEHLPTDLEPERARWHPNGASSGRIRRLQVNPGDTSTTRRQLAHAHLHTPGHVPQNAKYIPNSGARWARRGAELADNVEHWLLIGSRDIKLLEFDVRFQKHARRIRLFFDKGT